MSRWCSGCHMSLLALKFTGVDNDGSVCDNCAMPLVEAELIEEPDTEFCLFMDLESGIEVWIDDAHVSQLEEEPDSNPGSCEFESHRGYNEDEEISRMVEEYLKAP